MKSFRELEVACLFAEEIFGAVYFDSKPKEFEEGIYVVPETNEEKVEVENNLPLATGFEKPVDVKLGIYIIKDAGSYECPHCGEKYAVRFPNLNHISYGEVFYHKCDGEDGCGQDFAVLNLDYDSR